MKQRCLHRSEKHRRIDPQAVRPAGLAVRFKMTTRLFVLFAAIALLGCEVDDSGAWPPLGTPSSDAGDSGGDSSEGSDSTTDSNGDDTASAPDGTGGPDAASDASDAASPELDTADRDAGGGDSDSDAGGQGCEPPASCPADQRLVGCECVPDFDRKCLTDADCRADERCTEVQGLSICWWVPPPVQVCPGAPGCDGGGDGILLAGASSRKVTLDGFEVALPEGLDDNNTINFVGPAAEPGKWRDCGYDNVCPGEPGYTAPDEGEADGRMQGMWLAGFSSGRPAQLCPQEKVGCAEPDCCVSQWAHDDILVQVTVLRHNDVTVAFAALDTVGFFHSDIEKIRASIPEEWGIDLFVMAATHNHEGPDTAGQWGPGDPLPLEVGRNPRFFENIFTQTLLGIEESVALLEPVSAHVAVFDVDTTQVRMGDSRVPYIIDNNLPVLRFVSKATGDTVSTLLSLGNHAETLWANNPYITSDYPHFLRKYVRDGLPAAVVDGSEVAPALPGFGGVVVFFAGAVGGLINPGQGTAVDYAGNVVDGHSFAMADAVGQRLAAHVLEGWSEGAFEELESPDLRFATKRFLTGVKNTVFQLAAFSLGLLPRDVYNVTLTGFLSFVPDLPQLQTQTAVVRLGPVSLFTAPGECFPETLVGGFPGKGSTESPIVGDIDEQRVEATCGPDGLPVPDGQGSSPCIVGADQENPPDWSLAPEPPYVYDRIPGEAKFFIGLGMDFLGYMVPAYDYEAEDYFNQAPGDHYEETNGVGPAIAADWEAALGECIEALMPEAP
jgi:hypothetical protein